MLISVFDGWPSGPSLSALAAAQLELAKTHPRIFSLAIIPAAPAAGAVVQQEAGEREAAIKQSAEIARRLEEVTAASAMVILSRGVLAVMVRTFMAGLSLVSSSKTELKTFKTLEEAEAWFRTISGAPVVPEKLAGAIASWMGGPPAA